MLPRRSIRRKALLDITNNNSGENTNEVSKKVAKMPKRKASKNALLKIQKNFNISNASVEEKVVKKRRERKKKDVYEFTFSSEEESTGDGQRKKKRQRTNSTNLNDVTWKFFESNTKPRKQKVHRRLVKLQEGLRELFFQPAVKKALPRKVRKAANKKRAAPTVPKKYKNVVHNCSVVIEEKNFVDEYYKKKLLSEPKLSESSVIDDFDSPVPYFDDIASPAADFDENYLPPLPVTPVPQKSLREEICESFTDNYDDTATNITDISGRNMILNSLQDLKEFSGRSNVKIISNVVVRKPNKPNVSNPWRLNVLNTKNPHTFIVKDNSFTPCYDQDIVINSTLAEKISPIKKQKTIEHEIDNTQQTSLLGFVSSTKEHTIDVPIRAGRLFESPRKILGEVNFQSTPCHVPRRKIATPNISIIRSTEKTVDKENTLFGFSDENSPSPKKITPKKVRTVLFNDVVETKQSSPEFDTPSSVDIDALFQDVDKERLVFKVCNVKNIVTCIEREFCFAEIETKLRTYQAEKETASVRSQRGRKRS